MLQIHCASGWPLRLSHLRVHPSGIQSGHLRLKHLLLNHWAAEAVAQLKSFHRIRRRTAEASAEQKILVLFYFSSAFSKLPNDTSREAAAAVDRADGLLARLQAVTCLCPHSHFKTCLVKKTKSNKQPYLCKFLSFRVLVLHSSTSVICYQVIQLL